MRAVHPLPEIPGSEGPGAEATIPVRLMTAADLSAVVTLDRKHTGRERSEFYRGKFTACVEEPGLNTSLIAEADGLPVGFLFGRLFFGEFGIAATRAVLDAIGVHPDFRGRGIGRALVEQYRKNVAGLRVEAIDTLVDWDRRDLLDFFGGLGFRPSRVVDLVWDTVAYPFKGRNGAVTIRPVQETDLPEVNTIGEENGLLPGSQYMATKLAASEKNPAKNLFIVAEAGGQLHGFMIGSLYRGEFGIDEPRGVVDVLAVRESDQHQGVGSAIVAFLLERVRKLNVRHMETLTRWNNWPLLQFYEYVGFRPSTRFNLEWRLDH